MNLAITRRYLREAFWPTLASGVGMIFFVVLFVWGMDQMGPQFMEFLSSIEFLRDMLEMAFGVSLSGAVSNDVLISIAWLHPVVLTLCWGLLIAVTTRQTCGEVERGTAELLLTLPVSRLGISACGISTWSLIAVLVSFCPMVGVFIGTSLVKPADPVQFSRFAIVMVNFLALNLAVASIATLVGTCIMRRGVAIGVVAGVLVAFLAMNFLESFLTVIQRIRFISLLNYYHPGNIVRDGEWPTGHIVTLLGVSLICLVISQVIWVRRDIPCP